MWLSIQGMYEYDNTVFDGFDSPSYTDDNNVVHTLNRDDVINNILLQCAELEVVYPSIQIMKFAIGVWSASNSRTWDKLYKSMFLEYNPIWNVDADETEKIQHGKTETTTHGKTETTTHGHTETRTIDITDEETIDTTSTESVQGFNSNSWSESKKIENDGTDTFEHDGTDTIAHTGIDTVADSGIDTLANTGIDTITKRRTGNIGVTASQDLIEKERKIAEFSIVEYITQSFKERFCLLVY